MRLATGKKSMSSPPAHRTLVSLAQLNPLLPPQGQIKELEYTTPANACVYVHVRVAQVAHAYRACAQPRGYARVCRRAHREIYVYTGGRVLEKLGDPPSSKGGGQRT